MGNYGKLLLHIKIVFNVLSSFLDQNAFHFGPKRLSFWAKTPFILGQNAFYFGPKRLSFWAKTRFIFGPKRVPFWAKTHSILGQNAFHFGPKRSITFRLMFAKKLYRVLAERENIRTFAA